MKQQTITIADLRKHMRDVIQGAMTGETITVITYNGMSAAAIVPLTGLYGLALNKEADSDNS